MKGRPHGAGSSPCSRSVGPSRAGTGRRRYLLTAEHLFLSACWGKRRGDQKMSDLKSGPRNESWKREGEVCQVRLEAGWVISEINLNLVRKSDPFPACVCTVGWHQSSGGRFISEKRARGDEIAPNDYLLPSSLHKHTPNLIESNLFVYFFIPPAVPLQM